MSKDIKTKIVLRNDTLANWNQKNPVLEVGEIGVITDERTFKIGDGTSKFSNLTQIRAIASDVSSWAKKANCVDVIIEGYKKSDVSGALSATDSIAIALSKIENNITTISNAATKVAASNTNGYITVDEKEVKVYELKVDGTTIVSAVDGTISVGSIDMDKVSGLKTKLEQIQGAVPTYTIEKDSDSGDYAAVYHLKMNNNNVGVAINIPKDMVVKSGSVVTNPDDSHIGTYIQLVLNDAEQTKILIPADSLIEYVTSGSSTGDMVIINVSDDHKVTATITDGTVSAAKLTSDVQDILNSVANKVEKAPGKDLSTNDFTDAFKTKLENVTEGATKVEKSDTNGSIKINGVETAVYTLPDTVVQTSDVLTLDCGNADGVNS